MKKQTLILIALILIPLIAVAIAISPSSVMVFQNQTLTTMSFAEPLEGVDFGWCAPVALILTYVLFAAVVIYALTKKQLVLKIVRGVGFSYEGTGIAIGNIVSGNGKGADLH